MKTLTYYTNLTLGFCKHPVPKVDASATQINLLVCSIEKLLAKRIGRQQCAELGSEDQAIVNNGHDRPYDVLTLIC